MKHLLLSAVAFSWAALHAQPVGLSYVYGTGQIGPAVTTIAPIYVKVVDANGNGVANSPVTWTVTQGAPGLAEQTPRTTMSDANGIAVSYLPAYAVDPSLSFLPVEVDARGVAGNPIKFYFTSLATTASVEVVKPDPGNEPVINTAVGAIVKTAYQAIVTATDGPQSGQPIPNVTLRPSNLVPLKSSYGYFDISYLNDPNLPSAACINNPLSDGSGLATCDMQIGAKAGTVRLYMVVGENQAMPAITLNVAVGPAARITMVSGNGQMGRPGDSLPLAVRVTDSGGNSVAGAAVTWSTIYGSAAVSTPQTLTDTSGNVSTAVTLGLASGPARVRASISQTIFVDFDLTVASVVSGLQVVSGDDQGVLPGATFPNPLVVRVLDRSGVPLGGIPVTFTIGNGSVSASSVTTDASGVAAVYATAGADPGPVAVTASAQGFTAVFGKLVVYAPGPRLTAAGVRNAASGDLGLTPCGLASLKGVGLAPGVDGVLRAPDPRTTTLGPVDSVTIGGLTAVLVSVANQSGSEEIVVQTPCGVAVGNVEVDVSVQGLTNGVMGVSVAAVQPGVFEVSDDSSGLKLGWATHGDGSLVTTVSPAVRGEVIRIFATGLGALKDPQSPDSPELGLVTDLILGINDAGVPVARSGYLVSQPGFYFVEVAIPLDLIAGASSLRFVIGEAPAPGADLAYSNTVIIPVR